MTNQNHQTNGASLEDCHTNFFALTELYGIKWRKLVWGESSGGGGVGEEEGGAPLADPVISSYARCLAGDILCVWRRVPQPPVDIYDMPVPPPPLSLRAAKELWIFWYGEEPDLSGLVAPELIASQGDQGSWESGLSYECRSLLFKALHNLIERCLLSRDFVRLGKWFVQPYDGDEEDVGKSPWHLSFSFAFFLHGESTVCASVDVRQHPPVRTLTARRLRRVHQPRHCNGAGQGQAQGTPEPVRDKVILAPFGLEGTVTGREWADGDAATARLLDAWRHLYPLEQGCGAVEVVCGGVTMRYPLPYVLATEMESGSGAAPAPLAAACLSALTTPKPTQPVEVCYADASDKEDFTDPTRKAVCTCAKSRRRRAPRAPRPAPFHRRRAPRAAGPAPVPAPAPAPRAQPASSAQPKEPAGTALACGGSPGSCGAASPAPPSAPPSAGPHAHASPASAHPAHQPSLTAMVSAALGGAVAGVPASLHTPAPTPDPLAPHTPHTPVPAPAANAAKGYQTDSPSAPNGGSCPAGDGTSRPDLPPAERRLDPLEDEHSLKMLYDYTTVYAWLEHPVKRFKSEDSSFREDMALGPSGAEDLYAGHEHTKMAAIDYRRRDIKQEKQEDEKEYKNKNLFTSDGLCPTLKDLDQIFDNSDDAASGDETLQVQTPPDSNRSLEESRLTNAGAARSVRPEELSKMFPTPPSLEAHAQPSPGFSLPDDTPHHQTHPGAHAHAHRLGPASPPPDPIEDWSYVFKPPTVYKYVGSSKYAPLTTLPSQLLPPVALPPRAAYRPRWQREAQQPPQPAPQTSVGTPQQPDSHGQRTGSVKRSSSPTPSETRARARRSAGPTPTPARPAGSPDAVAETRPLPPACPLLVNVLLTDTVLNVFRDHNFDSCTLCVCNAGPKVVGNIRGADAVTYLPMALDGAPDEDPAHCTCGFSAILNRRLAHKAGLFYEDEMEITGLTEEPGGGGVGGTGPGPGLADVAAAVLRQVGVPAAPRHSALARLAAAAATEREDGAALNLQEYADGGAAAARALRAAASPAACPAVAVAPAPAGAVHRWPFIDARAPRSSRDVVRLMRRLRPLLQDAIQKRCSGARMWDGVTGPLTWRQFHRLAGRGNEDLCEPQPVPPLLVGHDRDWLSLSPYALRHWERLALEPYSHPRDVAYVVVAADAEPLAEPVRAFFRELSAAYEACRLGRHRPVGRVGRDGLVRAPAAAAGAPAAAAADEWAGPLPAGRAGRYVRAYAEALRAAVVPALAERALLEPERPERPPPEPMRPPGTPDHPPTPSSQSDQEEVSSSCSGAAPPLSSGGGGGTPWDGEESGPPALVVYLVEPPGSAAERARTLHALLRIADAAHAHLHHHNPLVKIISLEGICETWGFGCSPSVGPVGAGAAGAAGGARAARALALSVFTGARRRLRHRADGKSLTGFGTAADGNLFLNNKDEKNRGAYSLFAPLWVLAPARALKDVAESWGAAGDECGVLFLAYCLSHDQRHLLAAATDARGELLDTIAINIHVPARSRRRRGAAARRLGLTKLMDFILGVMSQAAQPWRLVVGRVGRIGHGELKGWSWLLSRKNLMRASNVLREICSSCSVLYPSGVPCILSACLVSTEPDSCLRLMADRFTPDERFSQVSIQSHLHTPRDVSATHILVFPTSATTQSNQMPFEPPLANGEDNDMNMFLDVDMGDEDIGEDNMTDLMGDMLFTNMWAPGSPGRQSPRRSREGSPAVTRPSQTGGEDADHQQEQVGTVLQQPLALGYLVSTAPLGGMPGWWWAGCAHLRDACPAFLKNALLLHAGSVQNADDYTTFTQRRDHNTHPLDSQTTTDVLRYVLEGYNALSWLALDGDTHDRMSCLPFHVQVLMQLYHTAAALG